MSEESTASAGLIAAPMGVHSSRISSKYCATRSCASSGVSNAKPSEPMPSRAATIVVSRRDEATQSGGWGFWSGFGITLRAGMPKYAPS